jgi:hypothetical protein
MSYWDHESWSLHFIYFLSFIFLVELSPRTALFRFLWVELLTNVIEHSITSSFARKKKKDNTARSYHLRLFSIMHEIACSYSAVIRSIQVIARTGICQLSHEQLAWLIVRQSTARRMIWTFHEVAQKYDIEQRMIRWYNNGNDLSSSNENRPTTCP